MAIKLVSSDLNGTLVKQHTMSDMIRLYIGDKQYRKAKEVFDRQTSGKATMREAFGTAGPLTRGLTLRQAIEYTGEHMTYVNGFDVFVDSLEQQGIPLVINSTGYSVTAYAIRQQIGKNKIKGIIGNRLEFGFNGDKREAIDEKMLEDLVSDWFCFRDARRDIKYDLIKATGKVELGIADEADKAGLITAFAAKLGITEGEIAHIGDTIGDSMGIYGIALNGGLGIAFNYNEALKRFLEEKLKSDPSLRIKLVDEKSERSDLRNVLIELGL